MIKLIFKKELYEMANFSHDTTGEPFILWIDEFGSERKTKHDLPRFKPEANGIKMDIVIDGNDIRFVNPNPRKLKRFKYGKEALDFIRKFKEPLLMHWNREIDTAQLGVILRLVNKKKYKIKDAIDAVINGDM